MNHVTVSLTDQLLELNVADSETVRFPVSTSRFGPGEKMASFCTPRGRHVIRARIGAGLPVGAVLRARRPTGEIWSPALGREQPDRDWILTRILWLSGCEIGRNRRGQVDSMHRYIYIHGAPESEPMGVPFSHGCIRMTNADITKLFDSVTVQTPVEIIP